MKKLFSAILIIVNVSCFAQANKWFVSFSVTPTIGGPSASLKRQMVDQRFNDVENNKIFFIEWTTKYPVVIKDAAVLLRGGARLNDKRSIYFVVGQSSAGSVEGFKKQGSFDWWVVGGSTGKSISVNYHTYQLTTGYLYSLANTRSKIGFGPSFSYSIIQQKKIPIPSSRTMPSRQEPLLRQDFHWEEKENYLVLNLFLKAMQLLPLT